VEAAQVSLLRWLRRQLRQPIPMREHLEAAVENDDVAEAHSRAISSATSGWIAERFERAALVRQAEVPFASFDC
jgi:hypothetical protein